MATSSLHALSNSMALSRNDKQSPHSSPRPTRRSATPNVCSSVQLGGQSNDIYANQTQSQQQQQQPQIQQQPQTQQQPQQPQAQPQQTQHHHQNQQQQNQPTHSNQPVLTSAHSLHSVNGNNASNNSFSNNKASYASSKNASTTSLQPTISSTNLNRMSAPLMPTSSSSSAAAAQYQQIAINKVLSKAQSTDINEVLHLSTSDSTAPPLPPRKSSPVVDNSVNRLLKPQSNSVTAASSLVNLTSNANMSTVLSRSSENITCCDFEVPKTVAPPIPKSNVINTNINDAINDEFRDISFSLADDSCEKVIVGPAETISGIIDTRPLEARKPTVSINNSVNEKVNQIISTQNGANNLYHLKISSSNANPSTTTWQQQQQNQLLRQQPAATSQSSTANSPNQFTQSVPQLGMGYVKLSTTSSTASPLNKKDGSSKKVPGSGTAGESSHGQENPLLYENVTINNKDCNVPYENINLEYIARLMDEGYSKENVITALGISRNNIEMACDILHEFVSKSSV